MSWVAVGSTVAGAVVSSQLNKGSTPATATQTKDPWSAAQPFMIDNLNRGQQLQNFYQKQPFNPQQIENYSNLFSDTSNFRNNTMPGLLDFANRGMNSSYQRQTGGAPGSGGGYGGAVHPGGMVQSGRPGAFAMPQNLNGPVGSSGGMLDLNGAQNPMSAQNAPPPAPAAPAPAVGQLTPEQLAAFQAWWALHKDDGKQQGGEGGAGGANGGSSGGAAGGDGGER